MTEVLNSLHPYNYVILNNTYQFTTISDVTYIAYFVELNMFESCKVYSFSFEPQNISLKLNHDPRISSTIIKIIFDFFSNNENALLFTCDKIDGKEKYRNELFNKWFKKYGESVFDKFNKNANSLYISIITSRLNPLKSKLLEEFDEFTSYLI